MTTGGSTTTGDSMRTRGCTTSRGSTTTGGVIRPLTHITIPSRRRRAGAGTVPTTTGTRQDLITEWALRRRHRPPSNNPRRGKGRRLLADIAANERYLNNQPSATLPQELLF
jgi:hypothetical protein